MRVLRTNATRSGPTVRRGARYVRFALVGVLISVAVALAVVAVRAGERASALSGRDDATEASANGLLVDLLNAETGQRGFLLTRNRAYLQPYRLGVERVSDDLSALAAASGFDARLSAETVAVRALAGEKLAELARTVALERSGRHPQAVATVATNAGQRTMDVARADVALIDRRAGELSRPARRAADGAEDRALIIDALLLIVMLALALRWQQASVRAGAERDRALSELANEAGLERALRRVASASAEGQLDERGLADLAAAQITELLDSPLAGVMRFDGLQRTTILGHAGAFTFPTALDPGDHGTVSATVARTGQPARVDDYSALDGEFARLATAHGIAGAIGVPIRLEGALWGCLASMTYRVGGFPPAAEDLLERVAAVVSVALANAQALATLRHQASNDGLTGLLNHRTFQQRLHEEHDRAKRHGRPVTLCVFDLDGFKAVNDTHGHGAGDRVLETVAAAFTAHRRAGDIHARVGGDEFAVIALDTDIEGALALADRLRAAATAALADLNFPVTLSAGVADLTEATTMHDVFRLADSALYWAKDHGRNQTVRYTPGVDHVIPEELRREQLQRTHTLTGLTTLVHAVNARTNSSHDHAERTAHIAMKLALHLGWEPERCARLREAALLHDIGKIATPASLLDKAGPLSADEAELMKTHTLLGARIAQEVLDPEQVQWVRSHHERPDGRGYPDGLAEEDIPDGALLIGIADAYHAITTDSNHRRACSPQQALAEIRAHAGTQFRPRHVDALEDLSLNTITPGETARPGHAYIELTRTDDGLVA